MLARAAALAATGGTFYGRAAANSAA